MNIKRIKELIGLMNENGLTDVEIEEEGVRIKLSKKAQGVVEQVIAAPVVASHGMAGQQAPAAEAAGLGKNYKEIKAPMVGTFYRASSPDADPYVQVGDVVQKGDVLCIVEAMKLMNEVKAEFACRIVDIKAENAEPLEFGQVMFLAEPI
ncbi:MAG: acetyl-CoA carboxylase biotin carboxyl carrier protein [Candidatus Omnitrophica bacterium]|nr:acetyl-CoA carboxylase biotin carboxyl carrier protein [Candidatus Omnitrophota bacterium]MDD5487345.1 acetyl-CoA carboxylase biotin carboxyl carrier protein [Candidatus Omnitrophota bacterium]